jgi:hypothetical protein
MLVYVLGPERALFLNAYGTSYTRTGKIPYPIRIVLDDEIYANMGPLHFFPYAYMKLFYESPITHFSYTRMGLCPILENRILFKFRIGILPIREC